MIPGQELWLAKELADPIRWGKYFWPKVDFYDKQREIIRSVEENDETYVPAGNMLGKDFVAGFIALRAFLVHRVVRVVTTSVKDDHLRVLWGEIGRFIDTARSDTPFGPLSAKEGGPLIINHRDIRKQYGGVQCKISYMRGMVSEKGEGMAGHHAPYTLGVIDEASGVDDTVYTQMCTWAKRILVFGNCNPCPQNHFFRAGVRGGDLAV